MAEGRAARMYKHSPSLKRSEEGEMEITRKSDEKPVGEGASKKEEEAGLPTEIRHVSERHAMHRKHVHEKMEMHGRHEQEHMMQKDFDKKGMNERHQGEHVSMNENHEAEMKSMHERHEKEPHGEKEGSMEHEKVKE